MTTSARIALDSNVRETNQNTQNVHHENNKCLIISEAIQAIPIKFAVKIVRLKGLYLYDHCHSDDLDLHSRSQYGRFLFGQDTKQCEFFFTSKLELRRGRMRITY